jgi:hypothetical protein
MHVARSSHLAGHVKRRSLLYVNFRRVCISHGNVIQGEGQHTGIQVDILCCVLYYHQGVMICQILGEQIRCVAGDWVQEINGEQTHLL